MKRDNHTWRCIDGHYTGCGKCIGYCSYDMHPGYLTKKMRQNHDCIKKGCYYYIPKVKLAAPNQISSYQLSLMQVLVSVNEQN